MLMYLDIYGGALQSAKPIETMTELHIIMKIIEDRLASESWNFDEADAWLLFMDGDHLPIVDQQFEITGADLVSSWKGREAAFLRQCVAHLAPHSYRAYSELVAEWREFIG